MENKKFHIVAVKDELTGEFLQPTFGEDQKSLERIFTTQIKTIPIWKENPTDFSLYHLGSFNQESGEIISDIYKIMSGHSAING